MLPNLVRGRGAVWSAAAGLGDVPGVMAAPSESCFYPSRRTPARRRKSSGEHMHESSFTNPMSDGDQRDADGLTEPSRRAVMAAAFIPFALGPAGELTGTRAEPPATASRSTY